MKGIHGALLNLLGAMGRMKVRGMPRALVIVLMLLIIGSILLYWAGWIWLWAALGRVDLHAAPDLDRRVLHRSRRLHREKLGGR